MVRSGASEEAKAEDYSGQEEARGVGRVGVSGEGGRGGTGGEQAVGRFAELRLRGGTSGEVCGGAGEMHDCAIGERRRVYLLDVQQSQAVSEGSVRFSGGVRDPGGRVVHHSGAGDFWAEVDFPVHGGSGSEVRALSGGVGAVTEGVRD